MPSQKSETFSSLASFQMYASVKSNFEKSALLSQIQT